MASHSLRPNWIHACLHGAAAVILALLLWSSGLLQGIEAKTFDLRQVFFAKPSEASDSIVLAAVDQESLDWVAENMGIVWPWPRELFGAVIDNFRRRGARAIGFDVLFTEYSSAGVSDDAALVQAIRNGGPFALGSVFPTNDNAKYSIWPDSIPRPLLNIKKREGSRAVLHSYPRASLPIDEIGSAVQVLCNVHHQADADGIYRRIHPLVQFDGIPLPSLGIGVFLAAHPGIEVTYDEEQIYLAGKTIPLDSNGAAILRFRGPQRTHKLLNAAAFIRQEFRIKNGELAPDQVEQDLAGKYILFGFTAPGLFDLRPSPTDGVFSGMEINATILDNLLTDDFIHPIGRFLTLVLVLVFTVLALVPVSLLSSLINRILAATCLVLLPPLVSIACFRLGYDFTLVPVQIAVITALTLSLVQGYFMTMGQERFIRHSFKHYLSPLVIDQLLSNPDQLKLGGERKEVTVFFSDLQGFTRMSEGLGPEALINLLNEYLTAMTDIILDEEGTVDKFVGDAIVAFWNAPLENTDHAVKAVRAALRCQERLEAMRQDFLTKYGNEMVMRIGINSGPAVVGNMGSSSRFNYTVLGDAVNLAARLEGANKYLGTRTMISQATKEKLDARFHCRELGRIRVVGRKEPVTVFEALSFAKPSGSDYAAFGRGLQLFYAGKFQEALAEFAKSSETDSAAAVYTKLCAMLLENQPEDWDGIFDLRSK